MSLYSSGTVSVGTTAVEILSLDVVGGALVQNRGPEPVYIGTSAVTADTASTGGVLLASGDRVTIATDNTTGDKLYGITASGTTYVSWIGIA